MELSQNIPLLYMLIFSLSLIFSALINNIFLRFAKTLGIRQNQGVHVRWSPNAKPALGGISFFVVFLICFVCLEFIHNPTNSSLSNAKLLGLLASVTIAFIMGLADDAFDTKPLLKFLTQFTCGLILLFSGTKINAFNNDLLNDAMTILWVVGLMNSINMLDNMDAITTIVSIVIVSYVLGINLYNNHALEPIPFLSVGITGALCGFLLFNWHPSKMFMGDTGSQFIGLFTAILGIDYCWNIPFSQESIFPVQSLSKSILIALLVFIIPITDTTTVVINRMMAGKSPFVGGKDHTTHHLFFRGITEKRIALLYFSISAISCWLAFRVVQENNWSLAKFFLFSIYPILIFCTLYVNSLRKKKK